MIPKVIHYVWVGGNPLTPLAERCIESWKKYCPDYEIKRWDETNFDINSNRYCKEAYESKKWAFVSDYIRVKVLYEYGGIYMDTDVEVTKPLDKFLENSAFVGFENDEFIQTGIIGVEKGCKWIESIIKDYDNRTFIKKNGQYDLTTNVIAITDVTLRMYPNLIMNGKLKSLGDLTIYPKDYFCPIDSATKEMNLTSNTHTIHHFCGSWMEKPKGFKLLKIKIKNAIKKIIGKKNTEKIVQRKREKERQRRNKCQD